jgi:hypothetical protein
VQISRKLESAARVRIGAHVTRAEQERASIHSIRSVHLIKINNVVMVARAIPRMGHAKVAAIKDRSSLPIQQRWRPYLPR